MKSKLFICLLTLIPCLFLSAKDLSDELTLPANITPLSKEELVSDVPNYFRFDIPWGPMAGKRLWLRIDDSTWVERYPDGREAVFKVLGHTKINDTQGTLVVNITEVPNETTVKGQHQRFIPDKGSKWMHQLVRNISKDKTWVDLGPMVEVE